MPVNRTSSAAFALFRPSARLVVSLPLVPRCATSPSLPLFIGQSTRQLLEPRRYVGAPPGPQILHTLLPTEQTRDRSSFSCGPRSRLLARAPGMRAQQDRSMSAGVAAAPRRGSGGRRRTRRDPDGVRARLQRGRGKIGQVSGGQVGEGRPPERRHGPPPTESRRRS